MEKRIGRVTHFYDRISVAVLALDEELKVGDEILIRGRSTEFTQHAQSMEIDHKKIQSAGKGAEVALEVLQPVRKGDKIFLVTGA